MTLNILPLIDINTTLPKPYNPMHNFHHHNQNPQMLLDGFTINSNLKFIKKIGAGTYGLIYLVQDLKSGKKYAAKMILKNPPVKSGSGTIDVNENKKFIQHQIYNCFNQTSQGNINAINLDLKFIENECINCPFLREIALHLKVHTHPNIITIHQVLNLNDLAIIILMDYFEQGDLFNNIIDSKIFQNVPSYQNQQILMKNCMLQLIDALNYCSAENIYHCDLKPENIMIHYNKNYKRSYENTSIIDYNEIHIVLIDFGLAMSSNLICCNACRGSSFYMAPERIVNFNTNSIIKSIIDMNQFETVASPNESNSKYFPILPGDIWSLGVLFINITCSRNPWPIANINEENQVFSNFIFKDQSILSSILPISNKFNKLLIEIFKLNPNERINLHDLYNKIINLDFFNDTDDEYIMMKSSNKSSKSSKPIPQNNQLYTPPETENENDTDYEFGTTVSEFNFENEFDSDSEYNYNIDDTTTTTTTTTTITKNYGLSSPTQSIVHMEQCDKKIKNFNCPYHA